ncbi:MAG: tRNA (adenosine(37)-N6)-dimethylallyltransferase MiaA [Defluviitaleaceae bacterium]|nr:tRNA (adenosine(37)-N6)-dimethylallyltransferase MiaA [Defluviitaleaceae bacterium]MCL2835762.1 tRNA (adenosine(37)-N6)-dimethylallyltransferase MiaA [Defluviitaleaceae bacterium]
MGEIPYIIIGGPTATGKTAAAVELALLIGGEVISADSMQVYKYMDIGTAKPTAEEMKGVPHRLIDELYPDEPYSAYEFKKRAASYAADARSRGKYPIICGGTGFYTNALINGTDFSDISPDIEFRGELYSLAEQDGAEALHRQLASCDPKAAEEIHPNNIKRVIRALEYFKQTGTPISAHNIKERQKTPENAKIAILSTDRHLLYNRINKRVDVMLEAGLEAEVRGLLKCGYAPGLVSMQGLGYKEIIRYINGLYSLDDAAEAIKTGTRHYAKRQLTWFTRQIYPDNVSWYDISDFNDHKQLAERIARELYLL